MCVALGLLAGIKTIVSRGSSLRDMPYAATEGPCLARESLEGLNSAVLLKIGRRFKNTC